MASPFSYPVTFANGEQGAIDSPVELSDDQLRAQVADYDRQDAQAAQDATTRYQADQQAGRGASYGGEAVRSFVAPLASTVRGTGEFLDSPALVRGGNELEQNTASALPVNPQYGNDVIGKTIGSTAGLAGGAVPFFVPVLGQTVTGPASVLAQTYDSGLQQARAAGLPLSTAQDYASTHVALQAPLMLGAGRIARGAIEGANALPDIDTSTLGGRLANLGVASAEAGGIGAGSKIAENVQARASGLDPSRGTFDDALSSGAYMATGAGLLGVPSVLLRGRAATPSAAPTSAPEPVAPAIPAPDAGATPATGATTLPATGETSATPLADLLANQGTTLPEVTPTLSPDAITNFNARYADPEGAQEALLARIKANADAAKARAAEAQAQEAARQEQVTSAITDAAQTADNAEANSAPLTARALRRNAAQVLGQESPLAQEPSAVDPTATSSYSENPADASTPSELVTQPAIESIAPPQASESFPRPTATDPSPSSPVETPESVPPTARDAAAPVEVEQTPTSVPENTGIQTQGVEAGTRELVSDPLPETTQASIQRQINRTTNQWMRGEIDPLDTRPAGTLASVQIPAELGNRFQGHGLRIGPDETSQLYKLLGDGIDPSKPFHSTSLESDKGSDASTGMGGNANERSGVFTLVSKPDAQFKEGGVGGVLVDDKHAAVIPELSRQFPEVPFAKSSEAPALMRDLLNQSRARVDDRGKPITTVESDPAEAKPRTPVQVVAANEARPAFTKAEQAVKQIVGERAATRGTAQAIVNDPNNVAAAGNMFHRADGGYTYIGDGHVLRFDSNGNLDRANSEFPREQSSAEQLASAHQALQEFDAQAPRTTTLTSDGFGGRIERPLTASEAARQAKARADYRAKLVDKITELEKAQGRTDSRGKPITTVQSDPTEAMRASPDVEATGDTVKELPPQTYGSRTNTDFFHLPQERSEYTKQTAALKPISNEADILTQANTALQRRRYEVENRVGGYERRGGTNAVDRVLSAAYLKYQRNLREGTSGKNGYKPAEVGQVLNNVIRDFQKGASKRRVNVELDAPVNEGTTVADAVPDDVPTPYQQAASLELANAFNDVRGQYEAGLSEPEKAQLSRVLDRIAAGQTLDRLSANDRELFRDFQYHAIERLAQFREGGPNGSINDLGRRATSESWGTAPDNGQGGARGRVAAGQADGITQRGSEGETPADGEAASPSRVGAQALEERTDYAEAASNLTPEQSRVLGDSLMSASVALEQLGIPIKETNNPEEASRGLSVAYNSRGDISLEVNRNALAESLKAFDSPEQAAAYVRAGVVEELIHATDAAQEHNAWTEAGKPGDFADFVRARKQALLSSITSDLAKANPKVRATLEGALLDGWNLYRDPQRRATVDLAGARDAIANKNELFSFGKLDDLTRFLAENPDRVPGYMMETLRQLVQLRNTDPSITTETAYVNVLERFRQYVAELLSRLRAVAADPKAYSPALADAIKRVEEVQRGMDDLADTVRVDAPKPASLAGADEAHLADAARAWKEQGVESPYFERWFGNSKVISEDGKPLMVVHVTNKSFDEFKPGGIDPKGDLKKGVWSGRAIWMKLPRRKGLAGHRVDSASEGARTIPLFAKIEQPFLVDDDTRDFARSLYGRNFPQIISDEALQFLRNDGYDGVIEYERGHRLSSPEYIKELVAFDPSQVKSALANRGTFDSDSKRFVDAPTPASFREVPSERPHSAVDPSLDPFKAEGDLIETLTGIKPPVAPKRELQFPSAREGVRRAVEGAKTLGGKAAQYVKGIGEINPLTDKDVLARRVSEGEDYNAVFSLGVQKAINRAVPDLKAREAINVYRDLGGDREALQRAANEAPKPAQRERYERALNLSPDELKVAAALDQFYDALGQHAVDNGHLESLRQNYAPRYVNRPYLEQLGLERASSGGSGRFTKNFRSSNGRIFDSIPDLEKRGYNLDSYDAGENAARYAYEYGKLRLTQQLFEDAKGAKGSDGRPAVDVRGDTPKLRPNATPEEVAAARAADRSDYVPTGAQGVFGNLAFHPDFVRRNAGEVSGDLRNLFKTSAVSKYLNSDSANPVEAAGKLTLKGIKKAQNIVRSTLLDFGVFHATTEGVHAVGHGVNPVAPIEHLDLTSQDHQEAIAAGLKAAPQVRSERQFSNDMQSGSDSLVRKIPGVGQLAEKMSETLFEDFIPSLKLRTFKVVLARNLERAKTDIESGRLTRQDVAAHTADQINAGYGHLNYTAMARNPTMQDLFRTFALAPDFLEARYKFAKGALQGLSGKVGSREQLRTFAALALGQIVITRAFNKLADDDWHWDHPFSFVKGNRAYTLRSVPEDLLAALTDAPKFAAGRESPLVRTAIQLLTGRNYRGEKVTAGDTLKETATSGVPISLKGLPGFNRLNVTQRNQVQSFWDQVFGTLGVNAHRLNPEESISALANQYKKSQGVADDSGAYHTSVYTPVRNALADGNVDRARKELESIYADSGKSRQQIAQALQASLLHPWTTSQKMDQQFFRTLSPDDLARVRQAQAARVKLLGQARSLVAGLPAMLPKGMSLAQN